MQCPSPCLAVLLAALAPQVNGWDAGERPAPGHWIASMEEALGGREAIDELRGLAVVADCSGPDVRLFRAFDLTEGPQRRFRYDYRTIAAGGVSGLDFVQPMPDQRQDRQALLEILRADRQAHLTTDAGRMAGHLGEEIIDLSSGAIRRSSGRQMAQFMAGMFDGAEYARWEDLSPPIIKISNDGRLAWVARQVRVDLASPGPGGDRVRSRFVSAYSSTYEKSRGSWVMTSVTSTFAPEGAD